MSFASESRLSIGIVVPIFNESAILKPALEWLRSITEGDQVVVVDGGSRDSSHAIAQEFFPTEIYLQPSRGAQLDHGARCLETDILLFLHADSRLPVGFQAEIRRALEDPKVVGGCFRLQFDDDRPMLRFYCWFTRFPGRFFHFGDQAFFVRRKIFEQIGGYRGLRFLEDVDFLRRLPRCGRFQVLPVAVVTSARRFLRHGIVRQQLRNILLVTLFELGVPAERLAALYPPLS